MTTGGDFVRRRGGRLRRWVRRLLLVAAVLSLLAAGAAWYATRHLAVFAKWAIERAFPGAVVEMKALEFVFPDRLSVESLVLRSRQENEVLLSLANGSVVFGFDDLRRRQLGEIRLEDPVIYVSPRLGEAFSAPAGTARTAGGPPWSVRRLVCDYGQVVVSGFGPADLTVRTKFVFDFRDFSPAVAPNAVHSFALWDVAVTAGADEPFLSIDLTKGTFTFADLFEKRRISSLEVQGGALVVGRSLREIFASSGEPSTPAAETPWTIGSLGIRGVDVTIDDERPAITDITFALNTSLQNVALAASAAAVGSEEQVVVVRNVEVLSPYDPLTRVLGLRKIEFTFTLAGLLRNELAALEITEPSIYVGPDLFWYMEDAQNRLGTDGAQAAGPGWKIKRLGITGGRLVIGSGGRREYGLPLNFWARAEDVSLDDLTSLKMQTELHIPQQKYSFPDYQLEFDGGGSLLFSYPPAAGEKNLVGVVDLSNVRWRQYRATECYVSITFDRQGINGLFGGKVYRGDAGGGFSFFFDPASPWVGWLYGLRIDLRRFTNVLSPGNFSLTGPLDFQVQMDAFGAEIERVNGAMQLRRPGKMVIEKLDDMLARIPPEWPMLKQSSTRVALEALRDFEYTSGKGSFWFVRSQGVLRLDLQGPTGWRNFNVVLHANDRPDGRWKTTP